MLAQRKALILASEKVYFWSPKNSRELACQVPVEGEKLNPGAEDFGALYEFVKDERSLRSSLNYNIVFKVAQNEKAFSICTVPFGGEVEESAHLPSAKQPFCAKIPRLTVLAQDDGVFRFCAK